MQTTDGPEPGIRRVLIYRMGSLGDTVVALPALHLIERTFPNAERRMLTNFPVNAKAPAAAAVLAENGLVHGYFRYTAGTRSVWELLRLWWTLRRWRPEVLVYLGPVRGVAAAERDAKFFRVCGILRQVGVPLTDDMQKHRFQPEHHALEPESERLTRNIAELGDAEMDGPAAWDLRLTEAERARAASALAAAGERPVLAVSVGTRWQSKDWGKENWRSLLARLGAALPGYALLLTGVQEERDVSEFAGAGWREAAGTDAVVLNLCGQLTPRETAAGFERARVFLGHDSGPMHLAAAVGTTCVAVFSAQNFPRVWFPHGSKHRVLYHAVECAGCGLEVCIIEQKRCIVSITVGEVVREVFDVLGEGRQVIAGAMTGR